MENVIKGLSGMLKFDSSINYIKKIIIYINIEIFGIMDVDKMIKKMEKWAESEDGQAYFENIKKQKEIKENRFKKFEIWLENNNFNKLLNRLILEHNDNYVEKCINKGYEPYPTRKMQFLFDYVTEYGGKLVKIKEFEVSFPHQEWEFDNYYFGIIWGQGSVITIWNKEDKKIIFSL